MMRSITGVLVLMFAIMAVYVAAVRPAPDAKPAPPELTADEAGLRKVELSHERHEGWRAGFKRAVEINESNAAIDAEARRCRCGLKCPCKRPAGETIENHGLDLDAIERDRGAYGPGFVAPK